MDVSNDIDSIDMDDIDSVDVDNTDDVEDSVDAGGISDIDKAIIDLLDSGFVDIETGFLGFDEVSIAIYPNPVSDRFHVRVDGSYSGLVLCDVYSIDGRLVLSESLMKVGDVLDISMEIGSLEVGVYVIEVIMDERKERYKVVKN